MVLPLGPAQWIGLSILAALILLDAVLAWIKYAAHGTFSWSKFGLFVRKQAYVLLSGILVAVTHKYGPPSLSALTSVTWWAGAIAVALQYVVGDILGTKLGILRSISGLSSTPPTGGSSTAAGKVG